MTKAVRTKRHAIIAEIEALHDLMTDNYIFYTEEAIDSVLESWMHPYNKPAILHHKDEDGKTVGRVIKAVKARSVVNSKYCTLLLTCKISDEDAKRGIIDGRYLTTSVGVSGTEVECSICGHKVGSGTECIHKRGKRYQGQLCYWIVKRMKAKEISFVIVPSDKYSQIIRYYFEGDETNIIKLKESLQDNFSGRNEDMDLAKALQKIQEQELTLQEATQVKQTLETENFTLRTDKENLTMKLQESQSALEEIQTELENEKVLREGLESELETVRLTEKNHAIDEILFVRQALGLRQLDKEAFEAKSSTALQECLEDLRSELNFKESLNTSPTQKEPIKESPVILKEAQKVVNTEVPLKEQVDTPKVKASSILTKIFS